MTFSLILYIILQVGFWDKTPFTKAGTVNKLKKEAGIAYNKKQFRSAKAKYESLVYELDIDEEEVILNLANCYFEIPDTANARITYEKIISSKSQKVSSLAFQQLGILAFNKMEKEKALIFTKQALIANPDNENARYNFELLKRLHISEKPQDDIPPPSQNKKPDSSNTKRPNRQRPTPSKVKNTDISEEKAKMILEAMQNEETQYLQQKKKTSIKPVDKNKPDW